MIYLPQNGSWRVSKGPFLSGFSKTIASDPIRHRESFKNQREWGSRRTNEIGVDEYDRIGLASRAVLVAACVGQRGDKSWGAIQQNSTLIRNNHSFRRVLQSPWKLEPHLRNPV